jgi:hypothetical protein
MLVVPLDVGRALQSARSVDARCTIAIVFCLLFRPSGCWCRVRVSSRAARKCHPVPVPLYSVLPGLWPSDNTGNYPCTCTNEQFQLSEVRASARASRCAGVARWVSAEAWGVVCPMPRLHAWALLGPALCVRFCACFSCSFVSLSLSPSVSVLHELPHVNAHS